MSINQDFWFEFEKHKKNEILALHDTCTSIYILKQVRRIVSDADPSKLRTILKASAVGNSHRMLSDKRCTQFKASVLIVTSDCPAVTVQFSALSVYRSF